MFMSETEAREILRSYRWTFRLRKRRKNLPYLYAVRRVGIKVKERYICPLSKLNSLTKEQLIQKLT